MVFALLAFGQVFGFFGILLALPASAARQAGWPAISHLPIEAAAFHDRWRATKGTAVPSREEIGAALSGHLCRCGAYDGIFRAVADACTGRFDNSSGLSARITAVTATKNTKKPIPGVTL